MTRILTATAAVIILTVAPTIAQTPLTEREELIALMSGVATYLASLQNEEGAIVDPIIDREHQYSTPYFAAGVACLVDAGYADEYLRRAGLRAMDKATSDFAEGHSAIPDGHGEFYIASLALALEWFEGHADAARWRKWRKRLTVPVDRIIESVSMKTNNWRTYAMKGEWLRAQAGLVDRQDAIRFIEDAWLNRTQRERIVPDKLNLYQDWNGDPQSHAVEAVGRGNLLSLIAHGYDGASADEIRDAVENGTANALFLQDPTGQCPPNGRTDNHVFNDVLYALIFDVTAERAWAAGEHEQAGRYRRAAQLGYGSIRRWLRSDGAWAGSFYVTKNRFDPADRVGYQPASQMSNYNATILFHLAEAWYTWKTDIPPRPTPAESMTYAMETDDAFGSAVIAVGGTQAFINLRGDSVSKYGKYWTPLGLVRISKSGWDSRLGPSDGAYDARSKTGATFGPTWQERGRWVTLADKAEHYRGTLTHVPSERDGESRCSVLYAPVTGVGGPSFYMDITVSAEGVHLSIRSPSDAEFGLLIPSIESDGRQAFRTEKVGNVLRTFGDEKDVSRDVHILSDGAVIEFLESVRSSVGWLKTARIVADGDDIEVFVYPRRSGDPENPLGR